MIFQCSNARAQGNTNSEKREIVLEVIDQAPILLSRSSRLENF
jgi:hypothetical protein